MPNGVDKNFRRLLMACAAYRHQYGEWPAQARLHPALMQELARLFDGDDFARLDHGRLDDELLVQAGTWLGVTPRRE